MPRHRYAVVIIVAALVTGTPVIADVPSAIVEDHQAAATCLAAAVSYEAGSESLAGQQAVAQVVLNRLQHPAFPKSVCGVVYQGSERRTGCQFTFTCDGSLRRPRSARSWAVAMAVAESALAGQLPPTVGNATHYHANYVFPRWAPALIRVGVIGAHIFYRFPGAAVGPTAGSATEAGHRSGVPPIVQFNPWGIATARIEIHNGSVNIDTPQ